MMYYNTLVIVFLFLVLYIIMLRAAQWRGRGREDLQPNVPHAATGGPDEGV